MNFLFKVILPTIRRNWHPLHRWFGWLLYFFFNYCANNGVAIHLKKKMSSLHPVMLFAIWLSRPVENFENPQCIFATLQSSHLAQCPSDGALNGAPCQGLHPFGTQKTVSLDFDKSLVSIGIVVLEINLKKLSLNFHFGNYIYLLFGCFMTFQIESLD